MEFNTQGNKKPILVYDGDCEFCKVWISRWRSITHEKVACSPYQKVADDYPDISTEQFGSAVFFFDSAGKSYSGAQAIFKTFSYAPNGKWIFDFYESSPSFAFFSEWIYKKLAENRKNFTILTRWTWSNPFKTSTCYFSLSIFLFLLSLIYLLNLF
tara:strand:+ start:276 stop:743 length:468 start_codon:yes stop_codon:yes gene_type:complete